MSHEPSEKDVAYDEVILCAGLPLTGIRALTQQEQTLFRHRARRLLVTAILWFAAIPASLAFPLLLWVGLSLIITDSDLLGNMIAAFAIAAIALGIPVPLFLADLALKRRRVMKGTLSVGSVRYFEGTLTEEDWTNEAYGVLRRARLVGEDIPCSSRIELHAASDVIYQVNGIKPKEWIAIELTSAACPPNSPARFIAPLEWQISEEEGELERRRLTSSEREEILLYARQIRRRRWLQMLLTAWFLAVVIGKLIPKLLGLQQVQMRVALWAAVTLLICAVLFYRQTLKANLYEQDSEHGWALIIEPEQVSMLSKGEHDLTKAVEVLPASSIVWMIGEKPAGWRRRIKK